MPKTTHNKTLATTSYGTPRPDGTWLATIDAAWRDHAGSRRFCSFTLSETFPTEVEAEDSAFGHALDLCTVPQVAGRLLADI